jgi:hypothetical protein
MKLLLQLLTTIPKRKATKANTFGNSVAPWPQPRPTTTRVGRGRIKFGAQHARCPNFFFAKRVFVDRARGSGGKDQPFGFVECCDVALDLAVELLLELSHNQVDGRHTDPIAWRSGREVGICFVVQPSGLQRFRPRLFGKIAVAVFTG